ncbi:MAG: aminopeptidase [Elusimicrobiales bacterium]
MMNEKTIEKYADVLIWGLKTANKKLKKYDTVLIRCDLPGLSLGEKVYSKLIEQGYNVSFRTMPTPNMEKAFYEKSDEKQRKFIPFGEKEFYENLNGNIYIHAPASLTHLKGVDTKKQADVAVSRKFLRDIMQKRESKGLFGWTLCTFPTEELARQARLSLKDYTDQIIKACFLDEKDPVKKWADAFKNIAEIRKWLDSLNIKEVYVNSQNTDLTVVIGEKRRFLGGSGHNIPSFEIFTSPDYRFTKGVYFANLPTYRGGNYIEKIKLEFKDGKAVKISAEKGQDYLVKTMNTDEGAKMLGEFSLTDVRFSRITKFMADILFDENYGGKFGNCHIAIGSAYTDTFKGDSSKLSKEDQKRLGFNDSAVHWDLINTEDKTVKAKIKDGKIITLYEKGMFKY